MFCETVYPSATKERKSVKRNAKQYLRHVKKNLHCSHSLKAKFLHQLGDEIFLYCEENEIVGLADLIQRFGAPESVASEFQDNLNGMVVAKYQNFQNKVLLIAVVILVTLGAIASAYRMYVQHTLLILSILNPSHSKNTNSLMLQDQRFTTRKGKVPIIE